MAYTGLKKTRQDYIKYSELNILTKYVYNNVDYEMFDKALRSYMPNINDSYVMEKWKMFQKAQMNFVGTFDKKFFYFIYNKMIEQNYKG